MNMSLLKKKMFYSIVILTYAFLCFWLARHIWGKPETSYEKNLHVFTEELIEKRNEDDCNYSIAGEYKTKNYHRIYQFTGWQAEKQDGTWESTLQNIILKGEECIYSVDIMVENLEYAPRIIGSNVEDDKYAYRAIFPTAEMKTGLYDVGLLLKDGEVIWTDYRFHVGIYFERTDAGTILINDTNLLFDKETDTFEGMGDAVCINVESDYDNQELQISSDTKAMFENTYLVFYANDITERIDLSQIIQSYEVDMPLRNGVNEIWIYCIVDDDTSLEQGTNYYHIENLDFAFVDKEK